MILGEWTRGQYDRMPRWRTLAPPMRAALAAVAAKAKGPTWVEITGAIERAALEGFKEGSASRG